MTLDYINRKKLMQMSTKFKYMRGCVKHFNSKFNQLNVLNTKYIEITFCGFVKFYLQNLFTFRLQQI